MATIDASDSGRSGRRAPIEPLPRPLFTITVMEVLLWLMFLLSPLMALLSAGDTIQATSDGELRRDSRSGYFIISGAIGLAGIVINARLKRMTEALLESR